MIKTKDELMTSIKTRIGEDTSDDAITLIEDLSDTIDDLSKRAADQTNWEQKYNENDEMWRKRYMERFEQGTSYDETDGNIETGAGVFDQSKEQTAPKTFEDLFKITE